MSSSLGSEVVSLEDPLLSRLHTFRGDIMKGPLHHAFQNFFSSEIKSLVVLTVSIATLLSKRLGMMVESRRRTFT